MAVSLVLTWVSLSVTFAAALWLAGDRKATRGVSVAVKKTYPEPGMDDASDPSPDEPVDAEADHA